MGISPEYRGSKEEQKARRLEEQKMTPQMREARSERLKRQGKSTDRPSQESARYSPYDIRAIKSTAPAPQKAKASASTPQPTPKPAPKTAGQMGTAPATKSENPTPPKKPQQAAPTISKPASTPTPPKKPQQAAPTISKPASTPKPRNYSKEAMGMLGGSDKGALSEDNAVMKKLRERATMSAAERDKAPEFKSKYADKLNKAMGYAKGGSVDGCAKKGKTRGRLI